MDSVMQGCKELVFCDDTVLSALLWPVGEKHLKERVIRPLLFSPSVENSGEFSNVQQRGMPPVIDAVMPVVTG